MRTAMILTIWRHGEAEQGEDDRLRELTVSGRDDVGCGSHSFHRACTARNITPPQIILHSPLVRTTQTGEIIAAAFAQATVGAVAALQPGSKVAAVDAAICTVVAGAPQLQHILLVSHQPLVERLVNHYLGVGNSVPFLTPGGRVTLALEQLALACGVLLFWALPPHYETDM